MKICVVTLTRDRLDYTKACFARLHERAGCDFTHFVFDQGSTDGTMDWLCNEYQPEFLTLSSENVGIHKAMNQILDRLDGEGYDLILRVDNDCELETHGALKVACEYVLNSPDLCIVSPLIVGLRHRPPIRYIKEGEPRVGVTSQIGGIFLIVHPVLLAEGWRFNEDDPVWGGDDAALCHAIQQRGGYVGYLLDYEANHYLTTEGQAADKPDYFARRVTEGGPPL